MDIENSFQMGNKKVGLSLFQDFRFCENKTPYIFVWNVLVSNFVLRTLEDDLLSFNTVKNFKKYLSLISDSYWCDQTNH